MIPKIIHYCWFGGNEKPELVKKCIQSWKKYCPDYQIIEWNEENFNIDYCQYTRQAYDNKKWAFVSDVARLAIIFENGGVYLDTDIELIKPIDALLQNAAFFGYESVGKIATGLGFGAEQGNWLVKSILDDYENASFILDNGKMDLTPCPERNSKVFSNFGMELNGKTKVYRDIILLSQEWLCPLDYETNKLSITDNTVSIHHYSGAWMDKEELRIINIERSLKPILGNKVAFWVRCRMYNVYNVKKGVLGKLHGK